jgi:hypothetical protein
MPTKTLASSNERRAEGYKVNKQRVTLNCCANCSGSDRLPQLFISKSKNSRILKNKMHRLPVIYRNNENSWVTTKLFSEWLHNFFVPHVLDHLKSLKLPSKALLFVDNAAVHKCEVQTLNENIKVCFFHRILQQIYSLWIKGS